MIHRPPNKDDADSKRLDAAFAMHSGKPMPGGDGAAESDALEKLASLVESFVQEAPALLEQLKQAQGQDNGQEEAPEAPQEDTGSPSAQAGV